MLSVVDLKEELGKNIYIYPIHIESIKSNSIDLHVSKFAWSLKTKKMISNDRNVIIDPQDTALIYSEESIYVSNKIGGLYSSKVGLVAKGAGHIGTTLDAQYIGCSLIAFHNHSSEKLELRIGSEFVTLQFWYLNSPEYENASAHDMESGHPRVLNGFENVNQYNEWRDENIWAIRKNVLLHKMLESDEYKKCKEEYERELNVFNHNRFKQKTKKYIKLIIIQTVIFFLLSVPAYLINIRGVSTVFKVLCENLAFPIMLSIISVYVILDWKESQEK